MFGVKTIYVSDCPKDVGNRLSLLFLGAKV